MNNNICNIIRIKHDNGESYEELAERFKLEVETVARICQNDPSTPYYSAEFTETEYDSRAGNCAECGSMYDSFGTPTNCTGTCDQSDGFIDYYFDGEEELKF